MPHKTIIRLSGVARNPANGFPTRPLGTLYLDMRANDDDQDFIQNVALTKAGADSYWASEAYAEADFPFRVLSSRSERTRIRIRKADMAVGGSVTGNLEVDNDVDWFKVRLEEGKSYRVRMRGAESGGGTLADPFLAIGYGESFTFTDYGIGEAVLHNDDKSESEKDSELVLSVTRTHDTWISAATSGAGTGTRADHVERNLPHHEPMPSSTMAQGMSPSPSLPSP